MNRKTSLTILIALFLISCAEAEIPPTPTSVPSPTATPTPSPSPTEIPATPTAAGLKEGGATIRSEKAKGNLLIEVPAIDTADIDTRDMFRVSGIGWTDYEYNSAARYYGVEGLKVKQE